MSTGTHTTQFIQVISNNISNKLLITVLINQNLSVIYTLTGRRK